MNKEKILIVLISIVAIILVNLPFLYFYAKPIDGYRFLGRKVVNSQDTYTYLSFIEQSKQGRILLENLYTAEDQKPSLLRPSYLVIGKLAKVFNLDSITAYHASRVILTIIFFFVLYKFLSVFFVKPNDRLLAYFVVLFSNGFGTINWIPEALTFLSLGEAPHFILSQILALSGIYFVIKFFEKENYKYLAVSSLLFLLLSFEHPFNIIVIAALVFVGSLLKKNTIVKSAFLAGVSSIGLLYQYFEISTNPILKLWQSQNSLLSPSPNNLLLGYGLLIILAIVGIEKIAEKAEFKYKFIVTWIFLTAILIYMPFNFQRRLLETVHIPISILATTGIIWILGKFEKYKADLIFLSVILLPIFSIYSLVNDFKTISSSENRYYYYLGRDENEAIAWLKDQTNFDDVILANKDYGNIIPGIIARKVYVGHDIQTVDLPTKINRINAILLTKNESVVNNFFNDSKIKYIFLGKNDPITQYGFHPESLKFLDKIYDKNGVTIYKVMALKS